MAPRAKKIFITQLAAGQQFREVFLVSKKTLAETKAGKPYLALGLMDKTGEVEARVWDNAPQYASEAEEGAFVLVVVEAGRDGRFLEPVGQLPSPPRPPLQRRGPPRR